MEREVHNLPRVKVVAARYREDFEDNYTGAVVGLIKNPRVVEAQNAVFATAVSGDTTLYVAFIPYTLSAEDGDG